MVSTVLLWTLVNPLSALLALAANVFYVVGYTMLLKRRTSQNIVWGGAAGCFPALIGWTAVTGSLSWVPVVLFAVVFFWTPPHFWALALRYREDYAAADVPMLPSVSPAPVVGRQIVAYSWVTVATSLLLWPVAGTSWFYPTVAAGARRRSSSWRRTGSRPGRRATDDVVAMRPMRLFHWSNIYLSLLFVGVALEPLVAGTSSRLTGHGGRPVAGGQQEPGHGGGEEGRAEQVEGDQDDRQVGEVLHEADRALGQHHHEQHAGGAGQLDGPVQTPHHRPRRRAPARAAGTPRRCAAG